MPQRIGSGKNPVGIFIHPYFFSSATLASFLFIVQSFNTGAGKPGVLPNLSVVIIVFEIPEINGRIIVGWKRSANAKRDNKGEPSERQRTHDRVKFLTAAG